MGSALQEDTVERSKSKG